MNLTRLLISRPLLTTMAFAGIAVLGVVAALRLPISELPNVRFPAVVVQLTYPGADSTTVREQVTRPVQEAVSEVNGITELTAVSAAGSSVVIAQLDPDTDVDTAAADISQAVSRTQRRLPDEVQSPVVTKANPFVSPLLVVSYTGASAQQLQTLVDQTVQPRLQLVSGVGRIHVTGGLNTQVSVDIDPQLLAARSVSLTQVVQAITAQNIDLSAGRMVTGGLNTQLTIDAQATADTLADMVVASVGGASVRLGELGRVTEGPAEATSASNLNGTPAVSIAVTAREGSNALETARQVRQALDEIDEDLPPGVTRIITSDQTVYTKAALSATVLDLVLAVLLASLIILIFLQSLRQTLIVLVAIPTSLLATTLMMYFLGFSLDIISLLAMSLLIGILVDDAIVVLENITRHLGLGKSPAQAAYDGRTEIGAAAVALTLTDVIVFLPVVFTSGIVGQILFEFGVTVVVATLFSLLVSFTLTPMLSAHWLRQRPAQAARGLGARVGAWVRCGERRLTNGYGAVLLACLRSRPAVLAIAVLALVLSGGLVLTGRVGTDYVPDADTGVITVSAQLPPGTSLETTSGTLTGLAERIRTEVPGVTSVFATAGGGGLGRDDSGNLTVNLVPADEREHDIEELQRRVLVIAQQVPGMIANATVPNPFVTPGGAGLPVILRGPDLETLRGLADQAMAELRREPALGRVQSAATLAAPAWNIVIDQERARAYGLTNQQIATAVAVAVGGTNVTSVQSSTGVDVPIHVSVIGADEMGEANLMALPVGQTSANVRGNATVGNGTPGAEGATGGGNTRPAAVTLGQVATVTHGTAPEVINDYAQQPQITVRAAAASGVALSEAEAAIVRAMANVPLPPGYDYVIGGEAAQRRNTLGPLLFALLLAPLLIYMLLAALYESLVLPFSVLLALPLATVGAIGALALAGATLNMMSLIGMLMLIGLVSKNAILLVDYTETLRRRGLPRHEAVVEAAMTRLRPIIMTSATMVVAMLPMAVLAEPGSEYRAPMALVIVGGMSTSTLLTLIVVPTLYTYLDSARAAIRRGQRDRWPSDVPTMELPVVSGTR
jgi:HAE1 family hydrophobic/amphiphilic exporter-1